MNIFLWIWAILCLGGLSLSLISLLWVGTDRGVRLSRIGFYMTLASFPFAFFH